MSLPVSISALLLLALAQAAPVGSDREGPPRAPHHTTPEKDGVPLGSGPIVLDAYIDFQCPYCRAFEMSSGDSLRALADEGVITLVYHPMDFLDQASTNRYSSRAASASGCAADADRFADYAQVLFANQPPEGGPGLTDRELTELGVSIGLTDPAFARCVPQHPYVPWSNYVTQRAFARGVTATPTTLVAGAPVPANAAAVAAAARALLR
ncbi:MAG: protein-disulfide isomerase-like protein [Mycobacterium sp.]|nr:protein-disulfide isomerase-like protein [Mycobacterium sp.]